jgi:hypothetical protein
MNKLCLTVRFFITSLPPKLVRIFQELPPSPDNGVKDELSQNGENQKHRIEMKFENKAITGILTKF